MASDKETEEKLSEHERQSINNLIFLTNQATDRESSLVNSEVVDGSSGSLYSLTESVSIPMSDSYISSDKEVETNDDIAWNAAYKLGFTASMDLLGNNYGMKVIYILDRSLDANIKGLKNSVLLLCSSSS